MLIAEAPILRILHLADSVTSSFPSNVPGVRERVTGPPGIDPAAVVEPQPVPFSNISLDQRALESLALIPFHANFSPVSRSPSPFASIQSPHSIPHASPTYVPPLSSSSRCSSMLPIFNCFSLNCNKANYIGHAVLNSLTDRTSIILFLESWLGKIGSNRSDSDPSGTDIYGMVHQKLWSQFIPVPHLAGTRDTARVTAYVNKSHISSFFRVSQRTDILEHPDLLILEVVLGNKSFLLINVYNDEHNSALSLLINSALPDNLPVIITGDFNLHHLSWSTPDKDESPFSNSFLQWAEPRGFVLLNEPEEVTFERGLDSSVLDLTWANRKALPLIHDWRVHSGLDFASDHLPITWSFNHPHNSDPPVLPDKFKFHPDVEKDWKRSFVSLMRTNPPPLPPDPSIADLDRIIFFLNEGLHAASIETA